MPKSLYSLDRVLATYMPTIEPITPDSWVCRYKDLPGVFGVGATPNDAEKDAKVKLGFWLSEMERLKLPLPDEGTYQGLSGKLMMRVPRALHLELSVFAEQARMSINEAVNLFIAEGIPPFVETAARDYTCMEAPETFFAPVDIANCSFGASEKFSGKWVQRLDKPLHYRLFLYASQQGTSMNMLATMLIAQGIGRRQSTRFLAGHIPADRLRQVTSVAA